MGGGGDQAAFLAAWVASYLEREVEFAYNVQQWPMRAPWISYGVLDSPK